jgi:hypothetical protein
VLITKFSDIFATAPQHGDFYYLTALSAGLRKGENLSTTTLQPAIVNRNHISHAASTVQPTFIHGRTTELEG